MLNVSVVWMVAVIDETSWRLIEDEGVRAHVIVATMHDVRNQLRRRLFHPVEVFFSERSYLFELMAINRNIILFGKKGRDNLSSRDALHSEKTFSLVNTVSKGDLEFKTHHNLSVKI